MDNRSVPVGFGPKIPNRTNRRLVIENPFSSVSEFSFNGGGFSTSADNRVDCLNF